MRYKKIILLLLLLPITFGGIYTFNSLSPDKKIIIHGKTIPYDDFAHMENETQLVVIGKKIKTSETIITEDPEVDRIIDAYSIADFKISKVINNKTNKELKSSDVIKVLELSASQKNALGVTTTFQYEDYEALEENKKFILYLDESKSDPGVYIIGAVNYGKIPLETAEKVKHDKEKIIGIHNQAKAKYRKEINSLK
ncbi:MULTISPECIES: hypothetical protein [Sutcliffiella]|uniref:Uncharacterized protein n=1 Tax=Sutcliffiella cohnii TaxID=33932 RepID=A0A223KP56_9BACI|nr:MULTISPECIES: hypothetical protein [Sutcliffiella]AST91134.1 hypothetical protein BC6307_07495 [Sutcliffiella cohnii]WBL16935.1 hypothetical protein O1A01_10000 [Sutcliffiella sp. NC1]